MTSPRHTDPRYGNRPRGVPPRNEPGYEPPAPSYPDDQQPPESGYGPDDDGYTPEEPAPEYPGEPGEPPARRCPPSMDCDTSGIDDLRCEAAGKLAEAAEISTSSTALDARQKAFETIRATYSGARDTAAKAVKELGRRLDDLTNKIRCELHRDEVECVERAFEEVLACVRECGEDTGCGIPEDCGFTGEQWSVGQIDDLRARIVKVEKYFDEVLLKEPAALTARVEAAKKRIDDLEAAKKAETETPARLLARAKEARWWLDRVYGDFGDVNEFQDCLCRGLNCSLQGRKLLSELIGDKKFQECQEAARRDRCEWLRQNIVEETLAVVLRICPPGNDSYPAAEPDEPPAEFRR